MLTAVELVKVVSKMFGMYYMCGILYVGKKRKNRDEYMRMYRLRKKMKREECTGDELLYRGARTEFNVKFLEDEFGIPCEICDRLWFQSDIRYVGRNTAEEVFCVCVPNGLKTDVGVCRSCLVWIKKNEIPPLSVYNGFRYVDYPRDLPVLNLVSERIISPRLIFMQIRR